MSLVSSLRAIEGRRRTLLICGILGLLALAFRLPGLGQPPNVVYDEEFFVPHGGRGGDAALPDLTHPPVSMLLIRLGVWAFGTTPFGWRLPAALAGSLLAPVLYLTAREVLGRERAALVAAGLFLCDDLYLLLSRLAMTNVFSALFQTAAIGCCVRAASAKDLTWRSLAALGTALGLALATRWTSIPLVAFLGLVFVLKRGRRLASLREAGLFAFAFAAWPAVVYAASYLPWLVSGHSLLDLVWLQRAMWNHHASTQAAHPYASPWYTWPWLIRPPLFHYQTLGPGQEWLVILLAVGNPLLWWASVPATVLAGIRGLLRSDERALLCAGGFAVTWLAWAMAPLGLVFAHYFLEPLVWACLALGHLLDRGLDTRARPLALAYMALVGVVFLHFYPVVTATPIPSKWFFTRLFDSVYPWRWLSSWY